MKTRQRRRPGASSTNHSDIRRVRPSPGRAPVLVGPYGDDLAPDAGLIDIGSRMDQVSIAEFEGAGNRGAGLLRELAKRRICPAEIVPHAHMLGRDLAGPPEDVYA
jgi:hypothetical protein